MLEEHQAKETLVEDKRKTIANILSELKEFRENLKFKEQEVVKRESELSMIESTIAEFLGLSKFSEKKAVEALEKMKDELDQLSKNIVAGYNEIMEEIEEWKSLQAN
jgi:chromosome segregation ATPase